MPQLFLIRLMDYSAKHVNDKAVKKAVQQCSSKI